MTAANLLIGVLALGLVIGFGDAAILLYLAVTFSVQRLLAQARRTGRHPGSGKCGVIHLMPPDGAQPR